MDFKMADTSERRVFCNTILLKYHATKALSETVEFKKIFYYNCIITFNQVDQKIKLKIKVPRFISNDANDVYFC